MMRKLIVAVVVSAWTGAVMAKKSGASVQCPTAAAENAAGIGNVSKQKREILVWKIGEIKSFLEKARDTNAVRLLNFTAELENEIKKKDYGLVFEEHRERVDAELEANLPVLTENKKRFIDNGGNLNFLIEGDNLAALKLLEKTHRGRIDVIYIDPPYNTGNKDFIYNDSYVDKNDGYRHSKWLSFMKKRLEIAQRLMSDKGVIFISIDDNEQANLKLLCDRVFGEGNFVGTFFWKKTATPPALSHKIRRKLEYVLCYQRKDILGRTFAQGIVDGGDVPLLNLGNPISILSFPAHTVRFNIPDGIYAHSDDKKIELIDNVVVRNGENESEFRARGHFKWGQKNLQEEINNGTYFIIKTQKFSPRFQKSEKGTKKPSNIIDSEVNVGTNEDANSELRSLGLDKSFEFPKPTSLIKYLIKIPFWENKDITILDFFAGSGTTGHAVMKLNAEDKGKRTFILVTNNENGICENVTYERLKRVIKKEDYQARLKYCKVGYVPVAEKLYYEYADELLKHIRELVELENGIDFTHDKSVAIALTTEDAERLVADKKRLEACRVFYRGHNVVMPLAVTKALARQGIETRIIPTYYYPEQED